MHHLPSQRSKDNDDALCSSWHIEVSCRSSQGPTAGLQSDFLWQSPTVPVVLVFCLGGTGNGLKTKLNSFYLFYSKRKSVNALFPWFSPCKQAPKLSKIYTSTNLPTFSADQFAYSFFVLDLLIFIVYV